MVHASCKVHEALKVKCSDGSACCSTAHGKIARTCVISLPHVVLESL